MGRGNWFPGHSLDECEVVYVEYYWADNEDDWDEDDQEMCYQDFMIELQGACPESFCWDECSLDHRMFSLGRDDRLVANNSLYGLVVDSQGDCDHFGVGLVVCDEAPAFAASQLGRTWIRIMKGLKETHYKLSGRSSAWTSYSIDKDKIGV